MSDDWKKRFEDADRERSELADLFHAIRTRQIDSIRTDADEPGYLRLMDSELADNTELLITELSRSNDELFGFSSMVSHDLNAPLSHIRAYTDLLLGLHSDNPCAESRQYLKKIGLATERMQELMDSLLRFAQVEGGALNVSAVNLSNVVKNVLTDFDHDIAQSGIVIVLGDLPIIVADELQIRQVFQNLIENSIKYRHKDVSLTLEISARLIEAGSRVMIEVKDNGIGFNNKYAERLFEPLARLVSPREFNGCGMGLATVEKIIVRHNGSISASGEEGKGAVFTVTLPVKISPL